MHWRKTDTWYGIATALAVTIIALVVASNFGILDVPVPGVGDRARPARIEPPDLIEPIRLESVSDVPQILLDVAPQATAPEVLVPAGPPAAREVLPEPPPPVAPPAPTPPTNVVNDALDPVTTAIADSVRPVVETVGAALSPVVGLLKGLFG